MSVNTLKAEDIRNALKELKKHGTPLSEFKYCLVIGEKVYWGKSWSELQLNWYSIYLEEESLRIDNEIMSKVANLDKNE